MNKFFFALVALAMILTACTAADQANGLSKSSIYCVEAKGVYDQRTFHGPFVEESWATLDSRYMDGSPARPGTKSITLVPTGGELYDIWPAGSARLWLGGTEEEMRAKYDEIIQKYPKEKYVVLDDRGYAVIFAPDESRACPGTPSIVVTMTAEAFASTPPRPDPIDPFGVTKIVDTYCQSPWEWVYTDDDPAGWYSLHKAVCHRESGDFPGWVDFNTNEVIPR